MQIQATAATELNKTERNVVTITQACEIVSVSRRTIYNWLKANKLKYIRTAGGSVRIFRDSLFR